MDRNTLLKSRTKDSGQSLYAEKVLGQIEEKELKEAIKERLKAVVSKEDIQAKYNKESKDRIFELIKLAVFEEAKFRNLPKILDNKLIELTHEIANDILGFGAIQPLIDNLNVSEIWGNSTVVPDTDIKVVDVWVRYNDGLKELTDIKIDGLKEMRELMERIVTFTGKELSPRNPIIDAWLPDGSRVSASIAPAAMYGGQFNIRKFNKIYSVGELKEKGVLNDTIEDIYKAIAKNELKLIVAGPTGAGKTTTVNSVCRYIPYGRNVFVIQDNPEIKPPVRMCHYFLTREKNQEDEGEVTINALTKHANRSLPNVIIVGELRGREAGEFLRASITGQMVISTIHATTAVGATERIYDLAQLDDVKMSPMQINKRIVEGIDIVIICAKRFIDVEVNGEILEKEEIFIKSINEVSKIENGEIFTTLLYDYEPESKKWTKKQEPYKEQVIKAFAGVRAMHSNKKIIEEIG